VLLDKFLCFREPLRLEAVVRMQFHSRLNPELGLALGVLDVHVRTSLLARKEVEPKPLNAQDRRTHSDRIAQTARLFVVTSKRIDSDFYGFPTTARRQHGPDHVALD